MIPDVGWALELDMTCVRAKENREQLKSSLVDTTLLMSGNIAPSPGREV